MTFDYLIVGAGLFGASFARLATDAGKRCLVIDKRSHVGGNCYSMAWGDVVTHWYGPHILHSSSPEAVSFFKTHSRTTERWHKVRARARGRMYSLPVNFDTMRDVWGVLTPADAERKLRETRVAGLDPDASFESRALTVVGKDLYELLFKGYTEKMWGRPCSNLPASLFSRLPVRMVCDDRYYADPWSAVPDGGYGNLFGRLLDGSEVVLGEDFTKDRRGWTARAARTLYTGVLDELYGFDLGATAWRALDFHREGHRGGLLQPCACLNSPDPGVAWTRITEFPHLHPAPEGRTTRVVEFPFEWARGSPESPAYPVRDPASLELHARYRSRAVSEGLLVGGRLGDYKYHNMDDTALAAMRLAEAELGPGATAPYQTKE